MSITLLAIYFASDFRRAKRFAYKTAKPQNKLSLSYVDGFCILAENNTSGLPYLEFFPRPKVWKDFE